LKTGRKNQRRGRGGRIKGWTGCGEKVIIKRTGYLDLGSDLREEIVR